MATIDCKEIDDRIISVNGKIIKKDMNDNWIASEEMSTAESRFFREFLKTVNRVKTQNLKATYTV